jgi:uncharacterized SAM-binding protein YcdF (DUF218 family)
MSPRAVGQAPALGVSRRPASGTFLPVMEPRACGPARPGSGFSVAATPLWRGGQPLLLCSAHLEVGSRCLSGLFLSRRSPVRRSPTRRDRGGIIFKLLVFLLFVVCLAAIYLARDPLLAWVGNCWIESDAPRHADAIIVLGDDNLAGQRARRAAGLYHDGWAPVIVASGRFLRPYFSVAELIERDLASDGVPAKAVIAFPERATHTVTEALALRELCRARGWRRVLVVTSNYHTRRARYVFRKLFLPSIEVLVIAAPDDNYNPDAWWQSRAGVKIFFTEALAYPLALWEVHRAL